MPAPVNIFYRRKAQLHAAGVAPHSTALVQKMYFLLSPRALLAHRADSGRGAGACTCGRRHTRQGCHIRSAPKVSGHCSTHTWHTYATGLAFIALRLSVTAETAIILIFLTALVISQLVSDQHRYRLSLDASHSGAGPGPLLGMLSGKGLGVVHPPGQRC